MEFYKLVQQENQYVLEEESGQEGAPLTNGQLSQWASLLDSCYRQQEQLPLRFRKYLTAYYASGEMEYVALAEAGRLLEKPLMDGFASTLAGRRGRKSCLAGCGWCYREPRPKR